MTKKQESKKQQLIFMLYRLKFLELEKINEEKLTELYSASGVFEPNGYFAKIRELQDEAKRFVDGLSEEIRDEASASLDENLKQYRKEKKAKGKSN
jgi:hypothetical protein